MKFFLTQCLFLFSPFFFVESKFRHETFHANKSSRRANKQIAFHAFFSFLFFVPFASLYLPRFSFLPFIDKGDSVELIFRKLSSSLATRKTRMQNLPASREELSHCFRIYSFKQKLIVNCILLAPSLDVIGN